MFGKRMMETMRKKIGSNILPQESPVTENDITDEQLLKDSTMFLYMFSKPRNEELSLVSVWKDFYQDLFLNYPPRIILQTLSNIIKSELKSRRNQEYVAEKLFEKFGKLFNFDYGKLDLLMSTKSDVLDKIDRIQFKSYKQQIEELLKNNRGEFDIDLLVKNKTKHF
jgi:hypothetical protein